LAVTSALIQSGLLNIGELDSFLAKRVLVGDSEFTEFIVHLVHRCICSDQPIVTPSEFGFVLDSLSKLFYANQLPNNSLPMINEIRSKASGLFHAPEPADIMARKEASVLAMEDYVRLYENSVGPDVFAEWYQKVCLNNYFVSHHQTPYRKSTSLKMILIFAILFDSVWNYQWTRIIACAAHPAAAFLPIKLSTLSLPCWFM
jgi:hypothetical protein